MNEIKTIPGSSRRINSRRDAVSAVRLGNLFRACATIIVMVRNGITLVCIVRTPTAFTRSRAYYVTCPSPTAERLDERAPESRINRHIDIRVTASRCTQGKNPKRGLCVSARASLCTHRTRFIVTS